MLRNIKNIVIYFLIVFFMYVILLRETIIEGKYKGPGSGKLDKAKEAAKDAADKVKKAAEEAADKARQIAEAAAAAAAALAKKILDEAVDKLLKAVNGIAFIFSSAKQNLDNVAANVDKDKTNSNSAAQAQAEKAKADQANAANKSGAFPGKTIGIGSFKKSLTNANILI